MLESREELELMEAEKRICRWVGEQRYASATRNHRDAGLGPSQADLTPTNHIRGAECEFAASVMLNLYWRPTIGPIREKDVGGIVQVRSGEKPDHRLIIKPRDADKDIFVLILRLGSVYRFGGWTLAGEAKKMWPLLMQHGDPAHFAPQDWLLGLEALILEIRN